MQTKQRIVTRTLIAGALAVGLAGAALPAANAKGLEVRNSGTCSMGSTWKLKAKTDNGRIQVEFEVDSNVVGQTWSNRITDQGVLVWSGTRTTLAPSGSYSVSRLVPNRAGTDSFVARATHTPTGEVCRGTVSFPG